MNRSAAFSRIRELLDTMSIIDSHEHLPDESVRVSTNPDFMMMFSHYCVADLLASGMDPETRRTLFESDADAGEKWKLFEPLYHRIHDGSYARAAHLAMEQFYGMESLTGPEDAESLTRRIREANTEGLYQRVLKDACHIELSLNFLEGTDMDRRYFRPVPFVGHLAEVTRETIIDIETGSGVPCTRLDRYIDGVEARLTQMHEAGLKGLKIPLAYMRHLDFELPTHATAEALYNRVISESYGRRPGSLGYEESIPLQNYLVHRLVEIATGLDVPVIFHTGLQTEDHHRVDDSRCTPLWRIAHRHRQARIVVLHAGFPWLEDAATLAKHYANVFLDLGWTHLMSPILTRRALTAYIDLVPMHKIFGFGGDYQVVEKVYGHLELAKRNIASVLAEAVDSGDMTAARAKTWCHAMLSQNIRQVYRL